MIIIVISSVVSDRQVGNQKTAKHDRKARRVGRTGLLASG